MGGVKETMLPATTQLVLCPTLINHMPTLPASVAYFYDSGEHRFCLWSFHWSFWFNFPSGRHGGLSTFRGSFLLTSHGSLQSII
jgi:hypothetical protein